MNSPPLNDLTERAREIFRLVVEGYLDSGSPVGSKALAGEGRVNLSPASIRNVLADLEARGLLSAPHTSAGRMPTDTGLRLFVDAMMQVAEPTREERDAIEQRLGEPGPIERARRAEAMRIFIGSENRLFSLSGSSVIASPYRDREGRVVGVLGVIGPTRLNYARVVPMVDFTARSLGKRIG